MIILFAITHVDKHGNRVRTFANGKLNHYETRAAAEAVMAQFIKVGELRAKVLGKMADSLEVWPVRCYDNGYAIELLEEVHS